MPLIENIIAPHNYKPLKFYEYFKTVIFIPVIFGYCYLPYTISGSRFLNFVCVIFCWTISYGSSYLMLSYVKHLCCSPYTFIVVEYVVTVTILSLTSDRRRRQFFRNLEDIDGKLCIEPDYFLRLKKITLTLLIFAVFTRILYSTALCFSFNVYCNDSPFVILISGFVLIAVDVNQMPRLIMFNLVKYRMNLLRRKIENLELNNPKVSVISGKNNVKVVAMYHDLYRMILDNLNDISKLINPFFLLSLVCCFPKIMLLLYNIISLHKKGIELFHLLVLTIEVFQWGLIPCLPGIVFERTRAEVDKMKMTLLQHYRDCSDTSVRSEIKEFIDYIERRPCTYYVFRLIPVDITLPVRLLNLCTTYFIVIIQFSHLFE